MLNQLYVFGSNGEAQLGIPAAETVSTPTLISNPRFAPEMLKSVRSGDNHTLFQLHDGTIYVVGDNRKGQLLPIEGEEDGHVQRVDEPILLHSGIQVRSEDAEQLEYHHVAATCEVTAYTIYDPSTNTTQIFTQGTGHWGELGRGDGITTTLMSSPTSKDDMQSLEHMAPSKLPTLPGRVIDLAAGVWHFLAILSTGEVYAWGKSRHGQLGPSLSSSPRIWTPTLIPRSDIPFAPVHAVAGKDFTMLFGASGTGESILLGSKKSFEASGLPGPEELKNWKSVHVTWHAVFVLLETGELKAWGRHRLWQLIPEGLPRLEQVVTGSEHVLGLTLDGRLVSWGWGKHGNCGNLEELRGEGRVGAEDTVSGVWNEINMREDGAKSVDKVVKLGAGFCTSFVVMSDADEVDLPSR